jgi:hypothetical protein
MKKTIIFVCCFFAILFVKAQSVIDSQSLTKEEMLGDFDYFYNIIDSVNARFAVVKQVTGVDILADIKSLRNSFDTVSCDESFYNLLYLATLLCKDAHISFSDNYPHRDNDTVFIEKTKANSQKLLNIFNKLNPSINPFLLFYLDGEYYVPNIYDIDFKVQIPEKAKLLKINDISIDKYIEKWLLPYSNNVRWDMENKKFYLTNLFSPQRIGLSDTFKISYSYFGENEVYLNPYRIKFPSMKGANEPDVHYFERDKILYIRGY